MKTTVIYLDRNRNPQLFTLIVKYLMGYGIRPFQPKYLPDWMSPDQG